MSVAAVVISGAVAWREGNWRRRRGLAMGFANHGGMWSDLVLLSMANAAIVPHVTPGWWLPAAVATSTVLSVWVHVHWYRPEQGQRASDFGSGEHIFEQAAGPVPPGVPDDGGSDGDHAPGFGTPDRASRNSPHSNDWDDREACRGDHMWPARAHGTWWRDLSWAGWAHVVYVAGELTVLIGFALHDVPADVVLFVAVIFTLHVPIGLLQPRWFLTGHIATVQEQPLLAPLLLALWAATMVKL